MLKKNREALASGATLALLISLALPPTPVAARTPADPDTPDAPQDTPTTIVNEYADDWVLYKGVMYWAHNCPIVPLANGPTSTAGTAGTADTNAPASPTSPTSPTSPDAPTVDTATIKRTPVGGGAQTTLITNNCTTTYAVLTIDDSGLYYYDSAAGKIRVIALNTPTPSPVDVTSASQVLHIRLDANFLYFSTTSANIMRVPKTGGTAETLFTTVNGPGDFIMSGQSIYWLDNGGLWWAPKTCATLPCAKTSLETSARGNNMSFGNIGEGGGAPASIVFDSITGGTSRIIELNCGTPQVCQLQTYYTAGTGWTVQEFRFVSLPRSGPLPVIDRYLFWTEIDALHSVGRLLRRLADSTGTQPSELYPGSSSIHRHIDVDSIGVYFSEGTIMRLPFTASAITRDLAVANIEVTQGIQNTANQIGLVANKTTAVRVYGKQNSGPAAGGVEAYLYGTRNGQPLPGSPLKSVNGVVALSTSFVADRGFAQHSWIFQLPASWLAEGNVVLKAQIDPRSRFTDSVPANNELSQTFSFSREPNVCLFFSPIRTDNPIPRVGQPNFWPTMERFARVWPVPGVDVYWMGEPIEELEFCSWHGIPYPCFGPYELDQGVSVTNFPSDKDRVIGKLMLRQAEARALTLPPVSYCQSGASVHSVGLVHPDADTTDDDGTLLGYANYYINAAFYKMEPFDSQPTNPAWYWPEAASVLAQEVTHNFNRRHIKCGTNDSVDNNFPYADPCKLNDGGQTNYYGFDIKSRTPIRPENASDFMTYTPNHSAAPQWQGQWVTDYTYNAIKGKFEADVSTQTTNKPFAPALPQAGQMVYVTGAIEPTANLGYLEYAYAQPLAAMTAQARSVWQDYSAASVGASDVVSYHLRLKDANGAVLDDRAISPMQPDVHEGETPTWPFLATFPAPAGNVARIELLGDSAVLAARNVGANNPAVSVVSPLAGAVVDGALTIQWQGSDLDVQDVLHYNVHYSPDNGANWIPLATDHPGTPGAGLETLVVQNPLALPGTNGATGLIRVTASDGFHSTSAVSGAFTVAQRAPEAHITSPNDGQSFDANDDVQLQGGAIDAESGPITGTALAWAVDGAGVGSGDGNHVRGLRPGAHTAQLTATDPTARTGSAQAIFHINPLVAAVGTVPVLDGLCDDSSYADAGSQIQLAPYADGSQATASIVRSSDKLWLCFTGLARGSDATVGRAGIWADVNNSQNTTAQADDLGFFVGEDGAPLAVLGTGGAGSLSAMDARVTASGSLWTAEMSINLASLGGAGHVIGARLSHNAVNSGSDSYAWPYAAQAAAPNTWGATVLGTWPVLQAINPTSATVGSGNVTLTLDGLNFEAGTTVLWNGAALNTTVVSATQLTAVVPAANLATAGTAKVQVAGAGLQSAPSPAGGIAFEVVNPTPVLSALTPDTTPEGGANVQVTVNGSNFAAGATVLWDGQPLPTTVLSGSQVQAVIGAAQLEAGRAVNVAVQNAGAGSKPSNALVFLVSSPLKVALPVVEK